jgi:hypothetical protein
MSRVSSGDPVGAGLTGSADLSCLVDALRRTSSFCLLDQRLPEGGCSLAARMKLATGTCHRPEIPGDIAEQDRSFHLHVLGVAARGVRGTPNDGSGIARDGGQRPGSWHTAIYVHRGFGLGLGLDMPALRSVRDVSDWIRAMVPRM